MTALWGKDLGMAANPTRATKAHDDEDGPVRKGPENTPQDIRTHQYLCSLANLIETERVTLAGVQQ